MKVQKKQFWTTYFIAKTQHPFLDVPKLIDLQVFNGVDMGRVLQTNKCCANIVYHIANEIRVKICNKIILNNRKWCIIVDESTTLNKRAMSVICYRCTNGDSKDIINFYCWYYWVKLYFS